MTEDQLQAMCWQYTWDELPQTRRLIWAVPNGSTRNQAEANKLKATGTLAGVHDLHMIWKGQFYTFELKVGNNQLTRDRIVNGKKHYGQFEWGQKIIEHGAKWFEIRTFEQFKEIINNIIQ